MSWTLNPQTGRYARQKRGKACTYKEHFAKHGAPDCRLRDLPTYSKITSREGLCR